MIKRTPEEWINTDKFFGYVILDPDGWDRKNFDEDWAKPITEKEMFQKLMKCTLGGIPNRNYRKINSPEVKVLASTEYNPPHKIDLPGFHAVIKGMATIARSDFDWKKDLEEQLDKPKSLFTDKNRWILGYVQALLDDQKETIRQDFLELNKQGHNEGEREHGKALIHSILE